MELKLYAYSNTIVALSVNVCFIYELPVPVKIDMWIQGLMNVLRIQRN